MEYQIEVKNPSGICKGVKKVTVDGKAVAGNVVPFEASKKVVKVEITLEAWQERPLCRTQRLTAEGQSVYSFHRIICRTLVVTLARTLG